MRIGIEITSRCNLRCAFCGHVHMKRRKADMDMALFEQIATEIQDKGHSLRSMALFGEPLLADNYVEALQYLARRDIRVRNAFYTNATLLTPEKTDELIKNGFLKVHRYTSKVWLGLDTMDADIYRQLRIGGDFEQTVENIKYFADKTRDKLPGLKVQRMLTRLNPDEPEQPFVEAFGLKVATRRVGRQFDKSRDLTVKPFAGDRRPLCRELWGTIWVGQDGTATSCCIDGEFEQSLGKYPDMSFGELSAARTRQQEAFSRCDYSGLPLCSRCTGDEQRGLA